MNAGGTAVLLNGLMSEASETEKLLVYGRVSGSEIDFYDQHGGNYPKRQLSSLGRSINPWKDLLALIQLRKIARSFSPDIIHTHTFKAGVLGRLVALSLRPRPRVVHTYHGHLLTGYFSSAATRVIILIERSLATFTDALVVVGAQLRDDLLAQGIGKSEQYKVILPGVESPHSGRGVDLRDQLGLDPTLFTVGFVARLEPIKRVDRFLQALSLLRVPYQALIAGDGEERASAEELSRRLGLNSRFLGWQDDIDAVFRACDIVALTSDNEGTSLTLIEAQLRGKPVVAVDVGSVSSALIPSETGLLVDADANAVAVAITRLATMDEKSAEQMSKRAREFASSNFSMKRFANDHEDLYRTLASST